MSGALAHLCLVRSILRGFLHAHCMDGKLTLSEQVWGCRKGQEPPVCLRHSGRLGCGEVNEKRWWDWR